MTTVDPKLLLSHGEFVRQVVRGLLRDEHQVEDVVQDTWLAALRSPPRRPRAWRAWLAKVGRNRALDVTRSEGRRRRREVAASRPEPVPAAAERLALCREVVEAVLALEDPYRTVIVDRFFDGLSTREIARRRDVSEPTVRARLTAALDRLRGRFDNSYRDRRRWQACLAPLAAAPTTGAAGVGVVTGGLIMKSKLLVLGAAVAGLAIGWGVTTLQRSRSDTNGARSANRRDAIASHPDYVRLQESNAALQERVRRLNERNSALVAQVAGQPPPTGRDNAEKQTGHGIDWAQLEQKIRDSRALLARMSQLEREGKSTRSMLPEMQARAKQLILEWNAAAARARAVTPYPMSDPRFAPQVIATILGGTVDLTLAQRARVADEMRALLAADPLPDDATPLQAYVARRKLLAAASGKVAAVLDAGQNERWAQLGPVWDDLQEGNYRRLEVGLRTGPSLRANITRAFAEHYALTDAQRGKMGDIVDRYVVEGRELLRRHGRIGDSLPELDGQTWQRLHADWLDLQRRMEREVLPLLSREQRESLQRQPPLIIELDDTGNVNTNEAGDRGF